MVVARQGAWALLLLLAALGGCTASPDGDGSEPVQTQNLVNGLVTVPAGSYYDSHFSATRTARGFGSFTASGGSGNDIRTIVTTAAGFTNWKNGHQFEMYYDSGKVTTGSFDEHVPKGTYHVVFDNTFSTFSDKR